jgi:hypothetical protein
LVVGAVALVAALVVIANQDDVETTQWTELDVAAWPVTDIRPEVGVIQEATVAPGPVTRLVRHAPGFIQAPVTEFMEEATVTPGLTHVIKLVPTVPTERLASISNFDMDAFMATNVELLAIPGVPPTAWTPDLGARERLASISNFDMDAFMATNVEFAVAPGVSLEALAGISNFDMDAFMATNVELLAIPGVPPIAWTPDMGEPEVLTRIALPYGRTFIPEELTFWLEGTTDSAQIYQEQVAEYEEFLAERLAQTPTDVIPRDLLAL